MVGLHAFFLWSVRGGIARGDPDFTAFYTAGRMLRAGQGVDLYDPAAQQAVQREFTTDSDLRRGPLRYIHPPYEALLFVPFAFLPYQSAFVIWDVFNLGMIVAAALLLRGTVPMLQKIRNWEIVLALLAFFPIFVNLFQGQDAILLLLLAVLAFRAMNAGSDFMAGCWLGAGLFRYQLVIPLVLILAMWGRRRLVLGFLAATATALLLSLAIVGPQVALQYPAYIWAWSSNPGFGRTPTSLLPNLLGLLTGWPGLDNVQLLLRVASLALSVGLLAVVARIRKMASDPRFFNLGFSCAVITAVVVGYNTSTYDLALLVLPLAWVADYIAEERWQGRQSARALLLPAVPLLISPLWFIIGMRWQKFNVLAIFLLLWIYAIRDEMLRRRAETGRFQTLAPLT
jgi:hypothetical protein